MRIFPWLQAARLPLYTIGITPLLAGNAVAWYEHGYFSWLRLVLSILIGFLIHLITAFVNDVADIHTDRENSSRTPFSGGSGVVVDGELTRSDLIQGASLAAILTIVLTCLMIFGLQVHWGILLFVGWGMLSATQYSLAPVRLAYRGGGEFLVLITYSIALVWAGYFVQAGPSTSALIWWLSAPIGFAVFSLIAITQFPDMNADRKAGKRSLVIMFGVKQTLRIVSVAIILSVVSVAVFLLADLIPRRVGVISLLCLPLVYHLLNMIIRPAQQGITLYTNISRGALILTLWFGLAPVLVLILDRWLK